MKRRDFILLFISSQNNGVQQISQVPISTKSGTVIPSFLYTLRDCFIYGDLAEMFIYGDLAEM